MLTRKKIPYSYNYVGFFYSLISFPNPVNFINFVAFK